MEKVQIENESSIVEEDVQEEDPYATACYENRPVVPGPWVSETSEDSSQAVGHLSLHPTRPLVR